LGKTKYYNDELIDSEKHGIRKTSIKHAFEMSSNVGISKLVQKYYGDNNNAAKFVSHLRDFNLDKPTGIDLSGEAKPYIKAAYDKKDGWSGTTLPWMSIGYESLITPLQMLSFYAAVANDGEMMKPYLVTEVQRYGQTIRVIRPQVVNRRIASKRTLAMARQLLEGVVENGTARDLRTDKYTFAGKTGTAQNNYSKLSTEGNIQGYQASFVGYFPADNPKYACIVTISNPKQNGFYGATVAGPVFREIADKAFISKTDLHGPVNMKQKPKLKTAQMPTFDAGDSKAFYYLLDYLDIKHFNKKKLKASGWTVIQAKNDSLNVLDRMISETLVPNVTGMRLRDALYLLENRGIKVEANGLGVVRRQSIAPGTKLSKGMYIALALE
jgi:cell division protein FtsI (penicillin-binding protein 3)